MINGNDYIKNISKGLVGIIRSKIILQYKILNLDYIVSNKKGSSSLENNIWPFGKLIIGPSGSGKTNTLLHLINNFYPIDKIYLYAKDTDEKKYQYLINKREQAGLKNLNDPHAFIEYSNYMNDVVDDINEDEGNEKNEELKGTINELKRTKDKLDNAGNYINEKTRYNDELESIHEKFDYQNNKVKKLKSELNEKNKNINTLKNNIKDLEIVNLEIITESNKINENYDKEIQKLNEELKENNEYFNNYEKDRIKNLEKINRLNRLNDELNKENQKTNEELMNKKN